MTSCTLVPISLPTAREEIVAPEMASISQGFFFEPCFTTFTAFAGLPPTIVASRFDRWIPRCSDDRSFEPLLAQVLGLQLSMGEEEPEVC
jgi:hypothetical protein